MHVDILKNQITKFKMNLNLNLKFKRFNHSEDPSYP